MVCVARMGSLMRDYVLAAVAGVAEVDPDHQYDHDCSTTTNKSGKI